MRSTNTRTQYFVEGECEKKLIRTLIEQKLILPGQTDVLNLALKTEGRFETTEKVWFCL